MHIIHPKLVTDEKKHPIAVQIEYADWLKIKQILQQKNSEVGSRLEKYAGSISLREDPLEYQQRIRSEWE